MAIQYEPAVLDGDHEDDERAQVPISPCAKFRWPVVL